MGVGGEVAVGSMVGCGVGVETAAVAGKAKVTMGVGSSRKTAVSAAAGGIGSDLKVHALNTSKTATHP